MTNHRVAVIQSGTILFDTPATLDKLARSVGEAAAKGARLAVFPEAFVGGYPKGVDFGARVGSRTDEGREWFRRYHAAAHPSPRGRLRANYVVRCYREVATGTRRAARASN